MTRPVTSASNIFRRLLCEGSERMEEGLPETDSDQSIEGTLLHEHAADPALDRSKLKPNQRDLLEINDRIVREAFERVAAQFGDELALKSGREQTWYLHRGLKSLFPGHPDLFEYRKGKLLVVLDFKFGFIEVTPANANVQLRAYAVMGAEEHDVENCIVAITQPRLPVANRLTIAAYTRADLEASRRQLYDIWDNAKKPDAPLNPSAEACRYCKARLICPAFREMAEAGAGIIGPVNGELTKTAREQLVAERLRQLTDDKLGRFLESAQLILFALDAAKDEARERIGAGQMPGWKLGKAKETRQVTDVGLALDRLIGAGLSKEKLLNACRMSLGDDEGVAKIYRETKDCTWKDARDDVNELLNGLIEVHAQRPSVIRQVKALT